jgi:hypothetical protein
LTLVREGGLASERVVVRHPPIEIVTATNPEKLGRPSQRTPKRRWSPIYGDV